MVVEIIIELAVQIAAVLAFYAAASLFPALLAWAQSWLAYLVTTGSRVLQALGKALDALVRFLIRARAWITKVGELTWKSSRFSIGYGRMAIEAARDVVVDLTANLVSRGLTGRQIDPEQLFISAGISGAVGGLVGGLEKSGVTKVLDNAGQPKIGADGLPSFVTFDKQARDLVNSVGTRSAPTPKPAPNPLLRNAQNAHRTARDLGVRGGPLEGPRLLGALTDARNLGRVERIRSSGAAAGVNRARATVADASITLRANESVAAATRKRAVDAASVADLYRAAGNTRRADAGLRDLADARMTAALAESGRAEASRAFARAQVDFDAAVRKAATARNDLGAAVAQTNLAAAREAAWRELVHARALARDQTTIGQQLAFMRANNAWATSFGSPKTWQETLFYDIPKDSFKGLANGAAKSAADWARGSGRPEDIWKDMLLNGATGAIRGGINSVASNTLFPSGGIEETLWKIGSKSLDNHVRWKIENAAYPIR